MSDASLSGMAGASLLSLVSLPLLQKCGEPFAAATERPRECGRCESASSELTRGR